MSELPHVRPERPAEPAPAATTPARLSGLDLLSFLCAMFAVVSLAIWGFTAWDAPWNVVLGIATPLATLIVWGLFASPRAVVRVHPFVRGLVELLIYLSATIAWWSAGQAWIGLGFALVAVVVGVLAGRRRLS
ncbi:YrdB family protein [Microbacterium sp. CnD16-F]|uniref:YrdB family protein n=1 Tax=Microbacterium sp. CnD16-F TaxID=2954493 RepID=UPI002097BF48|nr:YrdB family protein [Microbacterium sp. CnD16-F]MCO7202921.1 YrdB family protein [Microbacterium sp. CnD16-F]